MVSNYLNMHEGLEVDTPL